MARKKQTARKSTQKGKLPHEVAKDISSTEVSKSPLWKRWEVEVGNWAFECLECFLTTHTQDQLELHFQQDHNYLQVHGPAPVRQVEDSEDEVAEDISTREVINLASNSTEEAEFQALKMDRAEVQGSISVEVAKDISTRELINLA